MAVKRTTLVGAAVDELLQLIETRRLSAGDSLPSTNELSEELEVSRTVVREAIAELAGQGLLVRRQGKDTEITFPDAEQFERLLRLRFALVGARLEELREFRSVIAVGAARHAAERATVEDDLALHRIIESISQFGGGEALAELDQRFHREIARMSRNDLLVLSLEGMWPLLSELSALESEVLRHTGHSLDDLVDSYHSVQAAIVARDPEVAARAMEKHLGLVKASGATKVPVQQ
jgi:DNA-binding FadR family transcriptional regulator